MKYERELEAPAPTLTGNGGAWVLDRRQGGAPVRRTDEPAHTMAAQWLAKGRDVWTTERPATTVSGDARGLPEPGYRTGTERQWNENAVRVTVQQAAALQTFPPDYPWQGSRTKQFEQVGNAVPPLLAMHVLAALTGRTPS